MYWYRQIARIIAIGTGALALSLPVGFVYAQSRSIGDPAVMESLRDQLMQVLQKSKGVGTTERRGRSGVRLSIGQKKKPNPKAKVVVRKPKPKLDPLDVIIARAVRNATQAPLTPLPVVRWAYEGPGSPNHWGALRPAYSRCRFGERQSPVDLDGAIPVVLDAPATQYRPGRFELDDDGRTLTASLKGGGLLTVNKRRYRVNGLRFHRPSEHVIDGRRPDMSVHLSHATGDGRQIILAIGLMRGSHANPAVQTVLNSIPLEPRGKVKGLKPLDLSLLMPKRGHHYSYNGSMTTPPCTEGVRWLVMRDTVEISAEQFDLFARLFKENARPVQAANGRRVKSTM